MDETSSSADDFAVATRSLANLLKGPSKPRFEAIFSEGLRENGRYCRLIAARGIGLVGIATAKKIGGKPRRNHAKRRVREAIRPMPLRSTLHDYVVVVSPSAVDCQFEALQADLRDLLTRMSARWADTLESS